MNAGVPLAAFTGVQVGAALVASRLVVGATGPALLAFLRYALAVLFLIPFALPAFRNGPSVARADVLPIVLLGTGQFGALVWLLNLAIEQAEPPRVALVFATLPAVTAAVGFVTGRGVPSMRSAVGIGGSIAGIVLLFAATAFSGPVASGEPVGLLFALAATAVAAICSTLYRPYLARYGVKRVSVLAMLASLVPLATLVPFEAHAPISGWTPDVWLLIAFVGASSAAGYLTWLGALARMDAARVTAFLALSPITAAILSAASGGTRLTATDFAALALVAGSLCIVAAERAPVPKETRP